MSATAKLILDAIERDGELSMEGAQQLTGQRPSKIIARMAYYLGTGSVLLQERRTGKYFVFTGVRPTMKVKALPASRRPAIAPAVPALWHAWGMGTPPKLPRKPSREHVLADSVDE